MGEVLLGKYDLALFTYEKFLGMVLSAPHMLHQIGLVVVDEAQFVAEPGRGMVVELLLTYIRSARSRRVAPQLLALSAVIGDVNGFESWLGCQLHATSERPVPLTEGVIDRTGVWTFRREGESLHTEQLLEPGKIRQRREKQSDQDLIVPLVRHLVEQGQKIIVFRNQRGSAAGCANYLASELDLPAAQDVIASLPEGDPSAMSGKLRTSLQGGVAFHHGDLNREERIAVERGFRRPDGGIQVLVATSTVAAGVNTPASTVVVVETEFPGAQGLTPHSVAQYKNMAGRAGRLGFESEGTAILIADNAAERSQLVRRYIEGRPEPLASSFDARAPETWLVRLMAQVREVPRSAVSDLMANTYGGYLASLRDPRFRDTMAATIERLLDRMIADGLVEQEDNVLRLTILGRACGESPLSLESAMRLVEVLRRFGSDGMTPETLVTLLEVLPERDEDYTPQIRRGESQWQQLATERFGDRVTRMLNTRAESDKAYNARCKRALIVADWIDGLPSTEIEARFTVNPFSSVGHGDIRGFAEGSRFLLESAIRVSSIILGVGTSEVANATVLKRLELGIPACALPLMELGIELHRGELLRLWQMGIGNRDGLSAAGREQLKTLLGPTGVKLFDAARL